MSNQDQYVYGVQLLDDLHNYLPDILYNPSRFTNIQDLLGYIQSSTQRRFDLYSYGRGLAGYSSLITPSTAPTAPTVSTAPNASAPTAPNASAPTTPPPQQNRSVPNAPNRNVNSIPTSINSLFDAVNTQYRSPLLNPIRPGRIIQQRVTPISVLGATMEYDTDMEEASEQLLTNILTNLIRPTNLSQNFSEAVVVRPTQAQIDSGTTVQASTDTTEETCTICQDDIEANTQTRKINVCGHIFHKNCIDQWFERNVKCPVCRHDIRTQGGSASGGVSTTSH